MSALDFTAAIDAEMERVEEIIERLRAEIEELDSYSTWLAEGRLKIPSANGDGPEATTKPPSKPRRPRRQAPREPSPAVREHQDPSHDEADFLRDLEKATTRPASDEERSERRERSMEKRDAILGLLKEHDSLTASEIWDHLVAEDLPRGKNADVLRNELLAMTRSSKIKASGRPKVYSLGGSTEIAPADCSGAKTGPEKRIVAALEKSPAGLTSREVSLNAEIPIGQIGTMLSALHNRGVIRRQAGSENSPALWYMES